MSWTCPTFAADCPPSTEYRVRSVVFSQHIHYVPSTRYPVLGTRLPSRSAKRGLNHLLPVLRGEQAVDPLIDFVVVGA